MSTTSSGEGAPVAADGLVEQIRCSHRAATGGNDYIYCSACGLTWDYRKQSAQDAVADKVASALASRSAAATETLQHRVNQWAKAKLALDANRPDFTAKQLRDLEAQEAMLIALSNPEASRSAAPQERCKCGVGAYEPHYCAALGHCWVAPSRSASGEGA